MFPNPNDWLLVKALDEERLRKARRQRLAFSVVERRFLPAWKGRNPFSGLRQVIDSIRLKLKTVEGSCCQACCVTATPV